MSDRTDEVLMDQDIHQLYVALGNDLEKATAKTFIKLVILSLFTVGLCFISWIPSHIPIILLLIAIAHLLLDVVDKLTALINLTFVTSSQKIRDVRAVSVPQSSKD